MITIVIRIDILYHKILLATFSSIFNDALLQKRKIAACHRGLSMKIVTFLPEKWFHTIKPISLQMEILYQNIPKNHNIVSYNVLILLDTYWLENFELFQIMSKNLHSNNFTNLFHSTTE